MPFLEDIGLRAGSWDVKLQNPDGRASNTVPFTLSLTYNVRMVAWRVYPGTDRSSSEIQDILVNNENSPVSIFAKYGIMLTLSNSSITTLAAPWSNGSVPHDDPVPVAQASVQADGSIPFDPGAINIYFIKDIVDSGLGDIIDAGTAAYTTHAIRFVPMPPPYAPSSTTTVLMPVLDQHVPAIVFEDTASLSTSKAAVVASHEVGHALGLVHVCARQDQNYS